MATTTTTTRGAAVAARDALALAHLAEADRLARASHRRLRGLAELDDLQQVARLALLRAAGRCQPDAEPLPYLRACVAGALRQHVRDRVRLVRVPRRLHEAGSVPLGHDSLDATQDGAPAPLEQLSAPEPGDDDAMGQGDAEALALLVEQLPAADAAALRLTVLQGLSLRDAGAALGLSRMTVQRAQRRALATLRAQLEA